MSKKVKKADLHSMDVTEEHLKQLQALFPAVFEEGKVNFDKLRTLLGDHVATERERFGLQWAGKSECFKVIQEKSIGTLKPCRDESVNFDETENLFIEGDNLEVLKLLQRAYYGKVKMIYIDPPYNTGKEFVYPDNYNENLKTYLQYTGQVDSEGRSFSTNKDTEGRFHSKWLNMMYPRLFLARNLLKDDGLICISIDDNEVNHLRKLCDEVFGEENFIESIVWKKRYGGGAKEKYLVSLHEYILVYAKNVNALNPIFIPLEESSIKRYYTKKDSKYKIRGGYRTHPLEATKSMGERKNLVYGITGPDGELIMPKRQWLWGKERAFTALKNDDLEFLKDRDGNYTVHTKQYLKDENGKVREGKAFSIIDDIFTQHGTNEIIELFGNAQIFTFPKPSKLLSKILDIALENPDEIIIDLFAGSCSMAQAILEKNAIDKGQRKYIMVQLPEIIEEKSEASKAGFSTIAEVGKERIRRVITKIEEQNDQKGELNFDADNKQDLGFKVFKLTPSNFKLWNGEPEEELTKTLELFVDHINPDSSEEDVLFELLLKAGFPLTAAIEKMELEGKTVYAIENGLMLICLEKELTKEVLLAIAKKKPLRVICLDEGFKNNDQLLSNAVQNMKTEGVEDFRTI